MTKGVVKMNKDLIRSRLLELGMGKEEFAFKADIGIATVYNMLSGKKLSEKNAFNAAKVLGLPLELLSLKEQEPKPAA